MNVGYFYSVQKHSLKSPFFKNNCLIYIVAQLLHSHGSPNWALKPFMQSSDLFSHSSKDGPLVIVAHFHLLIWFFSFDAAPALLLKISQTNLKPHSNIFTPTASEFESFLKCCLLIIFQVEEFMKTPPTFIFLKLSTTEFPTG